MVFETSGGQVDGETLLVEDTGPSVVVLATSLPSLGLCVTATYLGCDADGRTLVGELVELGNGVPSSSLEKRVLAVECSPFVYERRAFVYDHLFRVADEARSIGARLQLRGTASAVRLLDPLAPR